MITSAPPLPPASAAGAAEEESARNEHSCEADFFVGVYRIEKGSPAAARPLFQSAVDHCPHDYFEYGAAKFELKKLGGQVNGGQD